MDFTNFYRCKKKKNNKLIKLVSFILDIIRLIFFLQASAQPYSNRVVREHRLKQIVKITINFKSKFGECRVLLDCQVYFARQRFFNTNQSVFHPITENRRAVTEKYTVYGHIH